MNTNYWDKVTLYVKSILDNLLKEKKTCQKYINCCQELKIGSIQNGKWCSVKAKQYQRTKPATFYCCFICARHTPQWTMRKLFCRYLIAIWALTVCFVCAFVLFFSAPSFVLFVCQNWACSQEPYFRCIEPMCIDKCWIFKNFMWSICRGVSTYA